MKAYLSFKLPEEKDELDLALKAGLYYSVLWDVQQYARQLRKYDEREAIPKEEIVEKLSELVADVIS